MALKPWYKVVTPREDLRDGRPLDASEFAVHLDHVRDNRAPADYQEPARFFDRTFLTKNLTELAVSAVRRLSGIKVETSAVFNLTTQFGGGKTHALTLLYHLAKGGPKAFMERRPQHSRRRWRQDRTSVGGCGLCRHRIRFPHRSRRERRYSAPKDALGRDRVSAWRQGSVCDGS